MTTADHTKVGRLYLSVGLVGLLATLVLGVILGVERVDPDGTALLNADASYQLATLFRVALPFLAIAPIFIGLSIAVVPLQVGARSIAFPRAAAMSFWLWLGGAVLVIGAYAGNGGPGGSGEAVRLFIVGLGVLVVGLILASICIAATLATLRAPGMRLDQVPLFSWASFIAASVSTLALPVLLANLMLFFVSHRYGQVPFGGSSNLMSHLNWAVTYPGVALYGLASLGIIADIVPTFAKVRQPMRSALLVAIGLAGVFYFAADHQRGVNSEFFSQPIYWLSTVPAIIPVLLVVATCSLAMKSGKPAVSGPLVLALVSGLVALLGSAMAALLPWKGLGLTDVTVQGKDLYVGTSYVQAQSNAMMFAALLGAAAGIAFWGPRLWGRRLPDKPLMGLAVLGLLGALLVAMAEGVSGLYDQPVDAVNFSIDGPVELLNALAAAGYALLALVVLGLITTMIRGFASGPADPTPWAGQTLEWAPPSADTAVTSAQPLLDGTVA